MTKPSIFLSACMAGAVVAAGLLVGGADLNARDRGGQGGGGGNVTVRDHRPQPTVRDHREKPTVRDHREKPTVRDHRDKGNGRNDVSGSSGGVKVTSSGPRRPCRAQVCATGNERPGRGRWPKNN
jgi:hypothetical protein